MSVIIQNPTTIFEKAVVLKFSAGKPGNTARLRPDQYQVDATSGWTKASRELLKSPESKKASSRQEQCRTEIKKLQLTSADESPMGAGSYLIAVGSIPRVEAIIAATEKDMPDLLAEVERMYPQRIEEARVAQNGLFNLADYPPVKEFLDEFYLSYRYYAYGAPDVLAKVSGALLNREQDKINADTRNAVQDIFRVLRVDTKGYIDSMLERIKRAEAGDKVKFKELLGNFLQFLDDLPARADVVDDNDLLRLGVQAKTILENVTSDMLLYEQNTRTYVAQALSTVQASAASLVTSLKGTRVFQVEAAA